VRWLVALLLCGCGSTAGTAPDGGGLGGVGGADASFAPDSPVAHDTATLSDSPSASSDTSSTMMSGKSVDECFTGLRALKGGFQDATRTSPDGKYRMRLALETGDRGGTSGSYAWAAVRVALETPDGNVCITDETALAKSYTASHHNCMDVLTIEAGGKSYVIQHPDTAADYADPTQQRRDGSLTISMVGQMLAGPIVLHTTKCNLANRTGPGACTSGGPCQ
jgi:hypothetical protein